MSGGLPDRLWDILFPRRCPFCGRFERSDLPCPRCQRELPWLLEREAEGHAEFVSRYACALRYQGRVADAVRAMKFRRRVSYAKTFGLLTAQCVQDHLAGRFDLITWVPLSEKSLRDRGYDQAELLARQVGRRAGRPPLRLFAKREGVQRQSSLHDAAQRRANVTGAFTLLDPDIVRERRVLVVDDVITTGATVSECGRLLRMAGAADVVAVALAKGGQEKERPAPV